MPPLKLALLGAAASFALAAPAAAQHSGHMPGMNMPGMTMPPKKKPAAKKKAPPKEKATAKKAPAKTSAKKPSAKKAPVPTKAADPHAGHDMSSMPGMEASPEHDMSAMLGMEMPTTAPTEAAGTNLPAGDAPAPPFPDNHAADLVYGEQAMAMGRHHLQEFHGGQKIGQVFFNLAEYQFREGRNGFEWDGEAWYGGDINRVWLKSEGEGAIGSSIERAEVQALYSHAIGPYFNLQGGVRYDFKPNPSRVYATIGVEGLAPGFFELEGSLYFSNKGELLARAEGHYDQRITQRLILQPRAELNFAAQNSRDIGIGAGLSDAELGLRLRYDIRREFAPYVGVQYSRAFGNTRRFLRDTGEDTGSWSLLTGIRVWF